MPRPSIGRLPRCGIVFASAVSLLAAATCAPAQADNYPSKPVRIIVPYGPGGIADVTMRLAVKVRNKLLDAYNEIMKMGV